VAGFEAAAAELEQMDGIERAYLLVNQEDGKAVTITVWDSEQAMSASAERAKQLRSRTITAAQGKVIAVDSHEVAVQRDFRRG
jgi:heme-degrading monooxygenase HmoA